MPEFLHENDTPTKTESSLNDGFRGNESPDWSVVSDLADKRNVSLGNINHHNKLKNAEQQHTGWFTKENVSEYIKDRYEENLEMLEELEDDHVLELYKTLMQEYPQLRIVKLLDGYDDDNACFSWYHKEDNETSYYPIIRYNFSDRETYIINNEDELKDYEHSEDDDRLGRKYSVKRLSFKLGADWRECAKNEYLSPDEVLLHEFGHAHDFIENYMRDEYNALSGDNRGPAVVYNAYMKDRANRSEYKLRSPTCDEWCSSRGSKVYKKYEYRLNAMGINNYDEYLYARNQYYRDMPDEAYADNFAYEFILNHYDDYFTDSDDYSDGRVHIEKNKTMELDPDFVHILNIHQGLGVEIDRLDGDNVVKHISGFLATNFYSGKNVYLYENGDPKNPGEKWRICQGVSGIYFTPIHDSETGKIKQVVTFTDQDGTYYHMNRSNQEADTVEATPEELFQDLNVWFGDKVQMIYRQTEDARDRADLYHPNIKDRIIYATNDDRNEITFTNQDKYDRCTLKRRWKTYYAYDGNNEYEILPLPRNEN